MLGATTCRSMVSRRRPADLRSAPHQEIQEIPEFGWRNLNLACYSLDINLTKQVG